MSSAAVPFRLVLRHRAVQLLLAADIVGPRVYPGRVTAATAEEMPTIAVYTRTDQGMAVSQDGSALFNMGVTLALDIDISAADPGMLEDQTDLICDQVLNALLTNPYFTTASTGYPIAGFHTLSTTIEAVQTDRPTNRIHLTLDCLYADSYEPVLGPFRSIDLKIEANDSPDMRLAVGPLILPQ